MPISAALIRAARALLTWKQADLASISGVAEISIKKIERGDSDPRSSTLNALERAFDAAGVEFTNGGQPGVRWKAGLLGPTIECDVDNTVPRIIVRTPGAGRTALSVTQADVEADRAEENGDTVRAALIRKAADDVRRRSGQPRKQRTRMLAKCAECGIRVWVSTAPEGIHSVDHFSSCTGPQDVGCNGLRDAISAAYQVLRKV